MNLLLLDIVKENFPDFNPETETDLIKAEKILKAHQKQDDSILLNDVNVFLDFFKNNGNKYQNFLSDENLMKILRKEFFKIDSSKNKIHRKNKEIKTEFGEDFSESIQNYITQNIQKNDWGNLRIFYKNYFSIISLENFDKLLNTISDKNRLILGTIPEREKYQLFLKEYNFGTNPDFYALQSDIDSNYFNKEILNINNTLSNHQKTDDYHKVFIGKIFVALGRFDAFTEELRDILKSNSKIGAKWASKENKLDKLIQKNKLDTEKDYGKTAEWIVLAIFYAIVGFASFKLFQWRPNFVIGLVVLELIVFLFANKKLGQHFEEESKSQTDKSFRRKLKKFTFKIFILQLYVLFAILILGIFGLFIAIAIATGGTGAVIIVIIIRLILKSKKK